MNRLLPFSKLLTSAEWIPPEISFIYIVGAPRVIQVLLAGDIQIAAAAPSAIADVVLSGGDLVTVAGMVNIPAFYLVVRPEIKSIQDLQRW
jgi:ABC-type nitrate/sulfonate/bicarbonate transport system substrate-binding protein